MDQTGNSGKNPSKKPRTYFDVSTHYNKDTPDELMYATFSLFFIFNRQSPDSSILKTPLMEDLMEYVESGNKRTVFVVGPTGSGKTTSVYWLYQQCHNSATYFHSVPIPVNELGQFHHKVKAKLSDKPKDKRLLLFVDISSPKSLSAENIQIFQGLLKQYSGTFIISVSSNFRLYLQQSIGTTFLRDEYLYARKFTARPFSKELTTFYLASNKLTSEYDQVWEACYGIPKLLTLYQCNTDMKVYKEVAQEYYRTKFDDVIHYMVSTANISVSLKSEAKLLWAAYVKLPYTQFQLTKTDVNSLHFVKSFMVSVENEIPEIYFKVSGEILLHYIKILWQHIQHKFKTDNVNVVNDHFENSISTLLLPKLTYTARAYDHKSGDIDLVVELEFQALLTPLISQMNEGVLYQTPCYHKAVDYIAVKKNLLGQQGDILIAMSVTAQRSTIKKKIYPVYTHMRNLQYSLYF